MPTPKAVFDAVNATAETSAKARTAANLAQAALTKAIADADHAEVEARNARVRAVKSFYDRPYQDTKTGTIYFGVGDELRAYSPYTDTDVIALPPVDVDGDGEPDDFPENEPVSAPSSAPVRTLS